MSGAAPVLGVLAGLIGIADTVPYVRDILRGTTRPHRGTWLIWSVLAVVVFFFPACRRRPLEPGHGRVQAVLMTLIFALAIRRGLGGLTAGDLVMLGLAGGGIAGWLLADAPFVATACVVVADLIGLAMMVPKTWVDPASETLSTFVLASVSGALAAGSVGTLDAALLLYPVYFCLGNGALALLIVRRRAALDAPPQLVIPTP